MHIVRRFQSKKRFTRLVPQQSDNVSVERRQGTWGGDTEAIQYVSPTADPLIFF